MEEQQAVARHMALSVPLAQTRTLHTRVHKSMHTRAHITHMACRWRAARLTLCPPPLPTSLSRPSRMESCTRTCCLSSPFTTWTAMLAPAPRGRQQTWAVCASIPPHVLTTPGFSVRPPPHVLTTPGFSVRPSPHVLTTPGFSVRPSPHVLTSPGHASALVSSPHMPDLLCPAPTCQTSCPASVQHISPAPTCQISCPASVQHPDSWRRVCRFHGSARSDVLRLLLSFLSVHLCFHIFDV